MSSIDLLTIADAENHVSVEMSINSFRKYNDGNVVIVNTQQTAHIDALGANPKVTVHTGKKKYGYPIFSIDELDDLVEYIFGALLEPSLAIKSEYFIFSEPDCFCYNPVSLGDLDPRVDIFPPTSYDNNGDLFWAFRPYFLAYGKTEEEQLKTIVGLFNDIDVICKKHNLSWKDAADADMRFVFTAGAIIKTKRFQGLYLEHKDDLREIIKELCVAIKKNTPVPEINDRITSFFSFDLIMSIVLGLYMFKWSSKKNFWNANPSNFPDESALAEFIKIHPQTEFIHGIKYYYKGKSARTCDDNLDKRLAETVFPVGVFCHNYLENDWYRIVSEQLELLVVSGLYNRANVISYGVYSNTEEKYNNFFNLVKNIDLDNKITIVRFEKNEHEFSTLAQLQDYSRKNPNGAVLYYSAKGTSRPVEYKELKSWRKCLEYFTIELWEKSVNLLKSNQHDVCGALYQPRFSFLNIVMEKYYAGNFWWASTKYVCTLPDIVQLMSSDKSNRTSAELWIGTGNHRWANYYYENVSSWYEHYFDPNIYRKIK